jgi:hypothetical protein
MPRSASTASPCLSPPSAARHRANRSAQDQEVKPVAPGFRVRCVLGTSYGTAETFFTAEELVLSEIAHRGVGVAESAHLAEEAREAGRYVSRTCSRASWWNPAAANALHVSLTEGKVSIGPRQPVKTSAVGPANDPLAMQLPVHHLRRRHIDPEPLGPGRAIGVVAISPAFRARAMSGSEGDRFVVEIQERVVMRLPLLMPAPAELERAGDPEVACVEADDLMAAVKDAPVARPRTPERDRFDVASWRYTITGRRHVVPVTLSNRQGSTHPAPIDPWPSSMSPFRQSATARSSGPRRETSH